MSPPPPPMGGGGGVMSGFPGVKLNRLRMTDGIIVMVVMMQSLFFTQGPNNTLHNK